MGLRRLQLALVAAIAATGLVSIFAAQVLLAIAVVVYLIRLVSGVRLHDFGCTLKAYRREVLHDMHLYGEMHRFLPVLAAWVGARSPASLAADIAADFPGWRPSDGCCRQCADLYRARALSQATAAALPGVR